MAITLKDLCGVCHGVARNISQYRGSGLATLSGNIRRVRRVMPRVDTCLGLSLNQSIEKSIIWKSSSIRLRHVLVVALGMIAWKYRTPGAVHALGRSWQLSSRGWGRDGD
jgi:hypothetical protein